MRLQTILGTAALLVFPVSLFAESKTYNEAFVDKLDGTIMVQHPDGSKPTALETGSTVEKGDLVSVYDKSWVILKTKKGDRIGMEGGTMVVLDEYYIQGPDRQIRLVLQKGNLLLKINGEGSRQSFFEVNTGSVVSAFNDSQCVLNYDGKKDALRIQYLTGKLTVIDKDNEQKIKEEYTEHNWAGGKMIQEETVSVDEMDKVNFNRFFNSEDLLQAVGNNILMGDSGVGSTLFSLGAGSKQNKLAFEAYKNGRDAYDKKDFKAAQDFWEQALAIEPDYPTAQNSLDNLGKEHPELRIDPSTKQFEKQTPK